MKTTDRAKAIKWFNSHSSLMKTQICDTNTELIGNVRRYETLTGREIEQIWRKETQESREDLDCCFPRIDSNAAITNDKENLNRI